MPRVALEPAEYPYFDYRRFTFSLGILAGDVAWLSGATAVRHDAARNAMVVDGDPVAQARVILDKQRLALVAGGMDLSHVSRLVAYVTPAAVPALPRLAALWTEIWGARQPSVAAIVVERLLRPEAMIEIEAIASRSRDEILAHLASSGSDLPAAWAQALAALRTRGLEPPDVRRSIALLRADAMDRLVQGGRTGVAGGLCIGMPALVDDRALVQLELTSTRGRGLVSVAVEGDPAAGDIVGQARDAYRRIAAGLEGAGARLDDVVKTTELITPAALSGYRRTADVRREVLAAPYPAATGVVCERLVNAGALIAIEAVAVIEVRTA